MTREKTAEIPSLFDEELNAFHQAVQGARSVLVTATEREDGDSIAAELAVKYILEKAFPGADRVVHVVNERPCPDRFLYLPGAEEILPVEKVADRRHDLGVVVDCGADRSGQVRPLFLQCPVKVKIDHHAFGNSGAYDISLSTDQVASTTEILYQFVLHPRWRFPLDQALAELIFVGLLCDTGAFQYDLARPSSFAIAAKLVETGFDFPRTAERVRLERTLPMKRLLGSVLGTLREAPHKGYLYAFVTPSMISECGATMEDAGDLIDELCFIRGVEVSLLFVDLGNGTVRISLRSKGRVNVGDFARRAVSTGGGHPRAAGCTFPGPLDTVVRKICALLDKEFARLNG